MREATAAEYGAVTATPHAMKRQMDTKRTTDVEWTYCGTVIAHKTVIYKRGKPISTTYSINPDYLNKGAVS